MLTEDTGSTEKMRSYNSCEKFAQAVHLEWRRQPRGYMWYGWGDGVTLPQLITLKKFDVPEPPGKNPYFYYDHQTGWGYDR